MATRTTPTETRQISRADVDSHRIALRRIEVSEHRRAELECSDEEYDGRMNRRAERLGITREELDATTDQKIADTVARILGYRPLGFFLNGDPRGYALKIEPEHAADLHKDWGGYGILAPDK